MKRTSLIAIPLLLAGCGEEEWELIADLAARAPAVTCDVLAGPEPGAVAIERLRAVTDSTFLLIDSGAREIVEVDARGSRVGVFEVTEDGPRAIALLSDAVRSGDTLMVVADAGRNRLRAFHPLGTPLWTVELDFPPQRLALAGDRLLVSAAGMDGRLQALLYEVSDGEVAPLAVPPARHVDAIARLFLNDVVLEGYPDGSALLAHHFVEPRAWRVGSDGPGSVTRLALPVAAETRGTIGDLPPIPIREEDLPRIATPAIASAADTRTGDFLYLTRSGRQRGGRSEKAVVRASAELTYLGARILDVNAVAMAYLPADRAHVIVVDDEGGWFRCAAP